MAVCGDYRLHEKIGAGTYGIVNKCKKVDSKDGKIFAVKRIKVNGLKTKEKEYLNRELNLLKRVKHEYMVEMIDCFLSDDPSEMCIVTEFCPGGTLQQYVDRKKGHIKESRCLCILRQMCEAVKFLYLEAVIHRDIKPTNVFLTQDKDVKLGDFGLAKLMDSPEMMKLTLFLGTPDYMSPEMVFGQSYDYKLDMWGVGICLYVMMTKKLLFDVQSLEELEKEMINYEEPDTSNLPYSKKLVVFLKQLLRKESTERPTPVEMLRWIENDSQERLIASISQGQDSVQRRRATSQTLHVPSPAQCNPKKTQNAKRESDEDISETSGYESDHEKMKQRRRVKSPKKRNSTSPTIHFRYFSDELGDNMADEMNDIVRQTLDMTDHDFLGTIEQLIGTEITDRYKKEIFSWRKTIKPWQNTS